MAGTVHLGGDVVSPDNPLHLKIVEGRPPGVAIALGDVGDADNPLHVEVV